MKLVIEKHDGTEKVIESDVLVWEWKDASSEIYAGGGLLSGGVAVDAGTKNYPTARFLKVSSRPNDVFGYVFPNECHPDYIVWEGFAKSVSVE